MTRRRGRTLTPREIAVWRTVAETVDIRMPGVNLPEPPPVPEIVPAPPAMPIQSPLTSERANTSSKTAPPPDVERPLRKRVAAGRQPIEDSLDLHGCRQAEAHTRLAAFLTRSHHAGRRLVLVVTGKGRSGEDERGVLRRLVPLWLAEPALAPLIIGFGEAGRGHGGAGALYIHLRNRHRRPRA